MPQHDGPGARNAQVMNPEDFPQLVPLLYARVRGFDRAEQYVEWAQTALEHGFAGTNVIRLAVADPPLWMPAVQGLFEAALGELGLPVLTNRQALLLGARQIARGIVEGRITPAAGAAELSAAFSPFEAAAPLDAWWQLDEAYECEYCRSVMVPSGLSVDEAVIAKARELVSLNWRVA